MQRTEAQKFMTAARKIERETAKLAQSWHEDYQEQAGRLLAACDRLSDRIRWVLYDVDCALALEMHRGIVTRLRGAVIEAREVARSNYRGCLSAESERLAREIREERKERDGMDGYRRELELSRLRGML